MTKARAIPASRAVVANIVDRHDSARVIEAAHRFEPGTIKLVTFKDEGDDEGMAFGPVTLYRDEPSGQQTGGVPWGTPDPDGVSFLGWLSKRQALTIARYLGATFVEV